MSSEFQLFTITLPPAPPPPGFFPEDMSLYKRPPMCAPKVNGGMNVTSPGAVRGHTKCTAEQLIATRESSILRACALIRPSELPMTGRTLLLLWCRALVEKRRIVTRLADVQLDCETLERDVVNRLGEETAKKTLNLVYNLGDTHSAKGKLMLSISNITYKSVERLGS